MTINVDGESDQSVLVCERILGCELIFIEIRQTIVEGIVDRSRIPLTFSCYGAKLNGIVDLSCPSLKTKQ